MSNTQFECPKCYKRCGNVGALKMHMKTHEKAETKSGLILKWVVKRITVSPKGSRSVLVKVYVVLVKVVCRKICVQVDMYEG